MKMIDKTAENLLVIVGPTASGKTRLAVDIAKRYDGEIVCADSRTIYRGMDIGTAKPTRAERSEVRHYCLDMVQPDQNYSVKQFQEDANHAITTIRSRDKLPILVGGSGLYIDAVIFNYKFQLISCMPELEDLTLPELQDIADKNSLSPPEQTRKNKRHLIGYIRRGGKDQKESIHPGTLILGLRVDKQALNKRIEDRVERMFEEGLIEETQSLLEKYGADAPGFATPGYKPIIQYLSGELTKSQAKQLFIRNDKQLAKRQVTWFKRNKAIQWIDTAKEAEQILQAKHWYL